MATSQGLPPPLMMHQSAPVSAPDAHGAADVAVRCFVFPSPAVELSGCCTADSPADCSPSPSPAAAVACGTALIDTLEPDVKQLALQLHGLKLGLKQQCAEYATGLAVQGVMNVDDLRRVSEVDAWAIIKRAGVKMVPQQTLMTAVFGRAVVDPDRDREVKDTVASAPPAQQVYTKSDNLHVRMEEQKLRILNDQSPPLTDEQRATLHPEVQRM